MLWRIIVRAFVSVYVIGHVTFGQDTDVCDKTHGCFRVPDACTSFSSCDALIIHRYNTSTNLIEIRIGSKHQYIAFGLNAKAATMDATAGEACILMSGKAELRRFTTVGRQKPPFLTAPAELKLVSSNFANGAVVCEYTRPVTPPGGSYMRDAASTWFLVTAYGTVTTNVPDYHGAGKKTTSTKTNLTEIIVDDTDVAECGKKYACFRDPDQCTSFSTCNALIRYNLNTNTKLIEITIGTKNQYIAFGLNAKANTMDSTAGEACILMSGNAELRRFTTAGKTKPPFLAAPAELKLVSSNFANGALMCKYTRPITPPGGSYMFDAASTWFLVTAYGTVTTNIPDYHGAGKKTTTAKSNLTEVTVGVSDVTECGKKYGCFRDPEQCTSFSTCNALIRYNYNSNTKLIEITIGTKNQYVAFGLNPETNKMDATAGEACILISGKAELKRFVTSGRNRPTFENPITELKLTSGSFQNGVLMCSYTRPVTPPSGSYMRDGSMPWFLVTAHGSVTNNIPDYHQTGKRTTSTKATLAETSDTDGCGKTYACFRQPEKCASFSSCNALIRYQYDTKAKTIEITIGTKNQYVAFGLNPEENKMAATHGEACILNSGKAELKTFVTTGKTKPPFNAPPADLKLLSATYTSGTLKCRYTRPLTPPANSYMRDAASAWYLVTAYGSVTGGSPDYHGTGRTTTTQTAKLTEISELSIAGFDKKKIAHACLMILAWVFFASFGIFTAENMKGAWPDKKLFGLKVWFPLHRIAMVFVVILTTIAFILVFVAVEGFSEGDRKPHAIIGVVVFIFAWIQPVMATFRPHPGAERRWIFNIAHSVIGHSAWILAEVNIFLGLDLWNITRATMWAHVGVGLAFEVIAYVIRYMAEKQAPGPEPDKTNEMTVEEQTSQTPNKYLTILYVVHGFLIGFAASIGIGLVVIVANETS